MYYISMTSYLALVTFMHVVTGALAKQCSYTSFGEEFHYTCLNSQYCCKPDSCCYSNEYYYGVYDLWYFWFCLCFGIFICSLASGAYYRKRQLRGMQVTAIHHHHPGQGMVGGMPEGLIHHPAARNLMVTTTAASGQPMYPPQGYYGEAPPNYSMYSTMAGPMYPAYAYMPPVPPPAYSSVTAAMGAPLTQTPPTTTTMSTSSSSSPSSLATSSSIPSSSATSTGPEGPPVST